jgi:hypothetical protein
MTGVRRRSYLHFSDQLIIETPILAYLHFRRCNGEYPLAGNANERSSNANHPFHQSASLPAIARTVPEMAIPSLMFVADLPVYARTGSDPWDNAVGVLKTVFTGTIAQGLSMVAIEEVLCPRDRQCKFT